MKILLIFFILISLTSCVDIRKKDNEITNYKCPDVFFSSENSLYVHGNKNDLNLEDIKFKATLNNYGYDYPCILENNFINFSLDLLIIIQPVNPEKTEINIPLFLFLYDENEKIVDKYYYRISDKIYYDKDNLIYEQTEIIKNFKFKSSAENKLSFITIGFVNLN